MLNYLATYVINNININEETLDGMGTFHALQTASFRRSVQGEQHLECKLKLGQEYSLRIPQNFLILNIDSCKPEPVFYKAVEMGYYATNSMLQAEADTMDMIWILT